MSKDIEETKTGKKNEEAKDLKKKAEVKNESVEETQAEVIDEQLDEDDFESSFFESDIEDLKNEGIESSFTVDENLYTPSIDDEKAVNKEYKSFIRFIKNPRRTPKNGKRNIVSKYVVFMQNPNNPTSKIMVDDISHINQNNIITNAFFHCRGSKSLAVQNLGKANFSRRAYNFSLVKIEKDAQHPELENQIKVFRFANQVDEILTKSLESDPENGINAKLYSDPLKGYKFVLNINEKEVDRKEGDGKLLMTNYTDSRFVDTPTVLQFNELPADWDKSDEGRKAFLKHVMNNSPVLEEYEAKEWDAETEQLVIEAVRKIIDNPIEFDKIYMKTYKKSYFADNPQVSNTNLADVDDVEEFKENPKAVKAETIVDEEIEDITDVDDVEDIDL